MARVLRVPIVMGVWHGGTQPNRETSQRKPSSLMVMKLYNSTISKQSNKETVPFKKTESCVILSLVGGS